MMTRFGIRLVTVLLAISMVPHPRCEHATADQQASGSKLHQKYSKEGRRTVVNMPFASIFGSELIGSTGGQRTDRHWLVQRIPSGELTMMHRAYPRFPIPEGWKNIMVPWKDTITYEGNSQIPIHPRHWGFPKWRVWDGRLAFFWGEGSSRAPAFSLHSGFFVVPFHGDAIDLRLAGREWAAIAESGKLHVRAPVGKYTGNRPVNCEFSRLSRRIIEHLYPDPCGGCDFVISSNGDGVFFTCLLPGTRNMGQDLSSKMIVFDFTMQDEGRVELQRRDPPRSDPVVRRESAETAKVRFGLGPLEPKPEPEPEIPGSLTAMSWIERESFDVPFSGPFTVAVDDDCYYFVTNGGEIYLASPAGSSESGRTCELVFRDPADPIIACIHDASTNRIFAFRRNSYIPVDSEHLPEGASLRFTACRDITRSEPLFYQDELGRHELADARFRILSEAAHVLRGQLQGTTQTED
jgi:hypothetical protein